MPTFGNSRVNAPNFNEIGPGHPDYDLVTVNQRINEGQENEQPNIPPRPDSAVFLSIDLARAQGAPLDRGRNAPRRGLTATVFTNGESNLAPSRLNFSGLTTDG